MLFVVLLSPGLLVEGEGVGERALKRKAGRPKQARQAPPAAVMGNGFSF